jgi:hypothetical protein
MNGSTPGQRQLPGPVRFLLYTHVWVRYAQPPSQVAVHMSTHEHIHMSTHEHRGCAGAVTRLTLALCAVRSGVMAA